jgi:hypothetical protein
LIDWFKDKKLLELRILFNYILQIFRKLFKDGLEIQKDRIKDLRKYAKEQRDKQTTKQRNEVESLISGIKCNVYIVRPVLCDLPREQ